MSDFQLAGNLRCSDGYWIVLIAVGVVGFVLGAAIATLRATSILSHAQDVILEYQQKSLALKREAQS